MISASKLLSIGAKARFKKALHRTIQSALKINIVRSYVERSVFVDDAYMLKYTPHGTFAFFPDETIGRFLRMNGDYSQKLTENVIALLEDVVGGGFAPIWLEVGANIGTQTIYAKNTGQFGKFICIEPDPNNFRLLETNLKLNDLQDCSQAYQIGIGSATAELKLRRSDWNFGGATFRPDLSTKQGHIASHFKVGTEEVRVEVQALDTFIQENEIDPQDIGLVWIDVEGFECEVLKGMSDILKRSIPVIFEYVPGRLNESEISEIRDVILNSSKVMYAFGPDQVGRQIDTIDDVQRGCDLLLVPART